MENPISIPTTIGQTSLSITLGKDKILSIVPAPKPALPSTRLLHDNVYWIGGKGAYRLPEHGLAPAIIDAIMQGVGLRPAPVAPPVAVSWQTFLALLCAGGIDISDLKFRPTADVAGQHIVRANMVWLKRGLGAIGVPMWIYFSKIAGKLGEHVYGMNANHGQEVTYFDAFDNACGASVAEPVEDELAGKNLPVLNFTNQTPIVDYLNSITSDNQIPQIRQALEPAAREGGVYSYTIDSPVPIAVAKWLFERRLIDFTLIQTAIAASFNIEPGTVNSLIILREVSAKPITDRDQFKIILRALATVNT